MHSTKRHVPSSKCLENEDGARQAAPRGEGKLSRKITGLIPEPGGQVCMSVLQIKYILQCWRSFSKHYCGVHHIHISLFAFIPGAGQEDWYRSRVSGVETWGKLNIKYFDKLQSRLLNQSCLTTVDSLAYFWSESVFPSFPGLPPLSLTLLWLKSLQLGFNIWWKDWRARAVIAAD